MPTYDYECPACGDRIEIIRPASEDQEYDCRNCSSTLRRVYNSTPVHFKGDGFYSTTP